MITKEDVHRALAELELSRTNVCVHSSLRTLGGTLEDGLDGLVDVFLENGCTLLVPAFSDQFAARPTAGFMPRQNGVGNYSSLLQRDYGEEKIFTTCCKDIAFEKMGLLPQHILCAAGSMRMVLLSGKRHRGYLRKRNQDGPLHHPLRRSPLCPVRRRRTRRAADRGIILDGRSRLRKEQNI